MLCNNKGLKTRLKHHIYNYTVAMVIMTEMLKMKTWVDNPINIPDFLYYF